jgi:hypothetical protein
MPIDIVISEQISVIEGYTIAASTRIGNNGETWGASTCGVWDANYDLQEAWQVWDSNASSGIVGDAIAMQLELKPGGGTNGVTMLLDDGTPSTLTLSNTSYTYISQVKLRAGVTFSDMRAHFDEIVVAFYRNGTVVETVNLDDIIADSTGSSSPSQSEHLVTVTPSAGDYTQVIISGLVKFDSPNAGPFAVDADSSFIEAFVYTA